MLHSVWQEQRFYWTQQFYLVFLWQLFNKIEAKTIYDFLQFGIYNS
jgi:hypothetical protein